MIVIFTEEESMNAALEQLMGRHFPDRIKGFHWFVIDFNGKSDLEREFPKRMKIWNYGDPLFVILRDNDGSDCIKLKKRLHDLAAPMAKPFKIRVVCQELESWFLGDSQAVNAAYPDCRFSNQTAKYRNPDKMTNASQKLAELTGEFSKVGRASLIAAHLDPTRNVSRSFQVFFETLEQHLG
ncbi:MAG: DUF4276 family protein [Verrucomicrobiales bacterium]